MKYISSTDARDRLSTVINTAQKEPVTIQRQDKEMAVVLSFDDYQRITEDNIEDFLDFCDSVGSEAKKQGLTEQKLKDLFSGE